MDTNETLLTKKLLYESTIEIVSDSRRNHKFNVIANLPSGTHKWHLHTNDIAKASAEMARIANMIRTGIEPAYSCAMDRLMEISREKIATKRHLNALSIEASRIRRTPEYISGQEYVRKEIRRKRDGEK